MIYTEDVIKPRKLDKQIGVLKRRGILPPDIGLPEWMIVR